MNKFDIKLEDYKLNESKVFRDAIHGYIVVEHLPIWRLIATSEVQRLRRVKQLGGTFMVFPSAEHSRFTHSLGVYENVREMVGLEEVRDHLSDYDKLVVMCAALLHDIGHGPFSHTFEDAMGIDHEEMTKRMIMEDSSVNAILREVHPDLPLDVASVITHQAKTILVQMVSSQLDADRMDYLLRDSYFAGVTYGEFDKERILRTLRIKDDRIVFKQSGTQAIEDYILARYHMYWQVYYHPVARSFEHLFISIIHRVKDLYAAHYTFKTPIIRLMPFLKEKVSAKEYEALDENVMYDYISEMREEEDAILSDLCRRFMNRDLFKYATLKNDAELKIYRAQTLARGLDPKYYLIDDATLQVPYKHYGVGIHTGEIEILMDNGQVKTLAETSEIVAAILRSKPKTDRKVYFVRDKNWRKNNA